MVDAAKADHCYLCRWRPFRSSSLPSSNSQNRRSTEQGGEVWAKLHPDAERGMDKRKATERHVTRTRIAIGDTSLLSLFAVRKVWANATAFDVLPVQHNLEQTCTQSLQAESASARSTSRFRNAARFFPVMPVIIARSFSPLSTSHLDHAFVVELILVPVPGSLCVCTRAELWLPIMVLWRDTVERVNK